MTTTTKLVVRLTTKIVVNLVCTLLICCAAVWAQGSTAQISGTVHDSSGLAVPDSVITVVQTATGAVRTATSGADGGYVLASLPIGPYRLEASKDGFSKYVQSGIVLQVDGNPTVDVALQLGSVSDQINVTADTTMVETHSTGVGQVVDAQRVTEMPLNGRDAHELIFLAGMASTAAGTAGSLNAVRNYPTVIISVAGGQGNAIAYLLDGAAYQDPYNNASLPLPFPDALQEFKVETSALPAQYGFHGGAAVNAVTKSGTNEFHGNAFEFLRNGNLNARDAFALKRDTLKRNQYGGTVGGPILKNKLFVFAGFQRTSQRSDPAGLTAFVPTAAMTAGDFTTFLSAACNGGAQRTLAAYPTGIIPLTAISPVALQIQKTLPQSVDQCGRTTYGYASNQDESLLSTRVDWQKSDKHSIFGRVSLGDLNVGTTYANNNPLSIRDFGVHDLNYQLALGDTYLIGAGVVNSVRVAASRTNVVKIPDTYVSLAGFQKLAGLNPTVSDFADPNLSLTVNGAFQIGGLGGNVPGESHTGPNLSVNDDISWVRGSHQFGIGGAALHQIMNYWSGVSEVPAISFTGAVTGNAMADFMTGNLASYNQGIRNGFYERQNYLALYAQDNWKVTPRLTINYGVRWEPYTSPYSKYDQFSHFDQSLFTQNVHSTVFKNAPAGLMFVGDQQYGCGNSANCPSWAKFFPRVGLAWDPTGDGKMTIRAAFGMLGDRNHMFWYDFNTAYSPFAAAFVQLTGNTLSNPWSTFSGGADPLVALNQTTGIGHASLDSKFPLGASYVVYPTNGYHAPYVNQWNVSVQRQVGKDWLLTANYLGNHSVHLQTTYQLNYSALVGTPSISCTAAQTAALSCSSTSNGPARRVLTLQNPSRGAYYGTVESVDDGGTGSYNALFLSAQKRLSHRVSVLANYTWAHCISDPFDSLPNAPGGASLPGNRRAYRSNCIGSDLRQLFNLSMVAAAPKFSNRILRIVASDWQVSPILQIKSAQFFGVFAGSDRALSGTSAGATGGQTANFNGSNRYAATQTVNQWMNPAAFSLPALGTFGNLGQNNFKGPGVFQLNVAFSRTFPLWSDKRTLQLRVEAFNLPNHLNPSTPVSSVAAPNFGQITSDISGTNGLSAGDPRIVQVAMKFAF